MGYFDNVNRDLLARADISARMVVELGCGTGALGAALKLRAPLARIVGVEIDAAAAERARAVLDAVVEGDIETPGTLAALDRALGGAPVELLLIGDVLEHLRDPWAALAALRARMATGAAAAVCLPNAAHWSLLRRQLAGDWSYGDAGLLDRTHLRFFTRDSALAMFAAAGFSVESVTPRFCRADRTDRATAALSALADAAAAMGLDPARARREAAPLQWLFTLRAGAARAARSLFGIGIRSAALSLSTIRLIQPVEALAGHRPLRPRLSIGDFALPRPGGPPGILVTYRLHPGSDSEVWPRLDRLAAEGWLILHDLDDHPAYLKAQRANDFRSIRAAHAVTVTTTALAEVVRPMNPNVHVLPNQVFDLPAPRDAILASRAGPLRALFAAINRGADWNAQCGALEAALTAPDAPARLTAIHAGDLAERMGPAVRALPFLDYPDYRREMLAADVAICPLAATEFNACKSDLKIVECLAHGTVPIVSAEAAAQTDVPRDHLLVAETVADWPRHLRALAADRDGLAAMKRAGLDWVIPNRMWHGHVGALDALHDRLLADLPRLEADRRARLAAAGLAGPPA